MNAEMPPAVVVHGPDHARQALAVAGPGAVTLLSAPAAACFLGPAWWRALIGVVAAEYPAGSISELLDCDDAAGRAMEALRLGQKALILQLSCPQHDAVLGRATAVGASLHLMRPPALDLGVRSSDRRLAAWLVGEAGRSTP